ncbi:hypothetical protein [Dyadobacter sp. CY312]|uniref:hypothetical protein n=1 Tax=Dyadobacter sp. CY312 TaxID=2907303 RepID=UPI001F23D784|nr:hypothetical protein [Dyadobacter sp. CY312]MCE7043355.1 hypothetical protein [Dyadobacter sp. CY312]
MKNQTLPSQHKPCLRMSYSLNCLILLTISLGVSSCEKNVLREGTSSIDEVSNSARFSSNPLFSSTYEIEELTATQFLSKIPENSKEKPFLEIAAQPRLDRQKIEFKLFADGEYEITTTQLEPSKLELLPPVLRQQNFETVLSSKTVVKNGVAHFYDQSGQETGKSQLKVTRFSQLANKIIESGEINKDQVATELMGHPLINEVHILGIARSKNAEIKVERGITKIKYDLSLFAPEMNESMENLSKYAIQYYDFKSKRMLGETLHDKNSNKLLYRSSIFYTPIEKGNQIEKIFSESFTEDPKTGLKTRHMKQTFYSNMKVEINI